LDVGIAHRLQPGQVNNGIHSESTEDVIHSFFIPDVGVPKDELPPANRLYSVQSGSVAIGQVVDRDDIEPGVEQGDADMGPDVASASGQQDHVEHFPYSSNRLPCDGRLAAAMPQVRSSSVGRRKSDLYLTFVEGRAQ
jgi:hypothetical protein